MKTASDSTGNRVGKTGTATLACDGRLSLAQEICDKRGVKLTEIRRQVLRLLLESSRPTGAYDLIDLLKRNTARPIGPPTVYRALEFLTAQGLVSKLESCNAFVPCAHPDRDHDCIFFICSDCGASIEIEDPRIEQHIADGAAKKGFAISRRTVEVQGICSKCSSKESN